MEGPRLVGQPTLTMDSISPIGGPLSKMHAFILTSIYLLFFLCVTSLEFQHVEHVLSLLDDTVWELNRGHVPPPNLIPLRNLLIGRESGTNRGLRGFPSSRLGGGPQAGIPTPEGRP